MKKIFILLCGMMTFSSFADIVSVDKSVSRPARGTTANSRSISARNTSSSRNATQARTGTATASRANMAGARVASRTSRSATTNSGVTSRSATATKGVAARAGSLVQTDTVNKPLYTGRVSVRSSSAMQARAPSAAAVSVVQDVTTTSGTDINEMDQLAQMTDYCKAQYMSCMDNFCNVLDDNQGRCSCSKNLKNYEKTETALKSATEALQDVAQQIQYIGLSKDQVETLFSQTEAELQMQNTKDNTQLKNDLDKIKDMIIGVKTSNATSSETGMSLDFSGLLMGFNIDSTGFDLTTLFGGTTNTNSISNQRGEQLYKTAAARCKTAVLNSCQSQGVDISVITNSYDLEIDKQCIVYERSLNEANDNMSNTVRNAKGVLQKARLMVAQQKNSYDLRGCVNALDSCMQDEFVCGADYENCLDPTGKYIVNGEIVNGSAPGKANDITDGSPAGGLYGVWNYGSGPDNAWQSNHNLSEYVAETMFKSVSDFDKNKSYGISEYLQGKIGYHDDTTGKNIGMCISVLNQCQDYTYDKDGKYKPNNQIISEYLQRTLVQIKAAQDEMLADHAEDCLNDVASCLQQNNYNNLSNIAVNACKRHVVTCMSVLGENTQNLTIEQMLKWTNSTLCPANQILHNGTCIDVAHYDCINPTNSSSFAGVWNETTKTCACPTGKVLYNNACVTNAFYTCENPTGSQTVAGKWDVEVQRCDCPIDTVWHNNVCMTQARFICENPTDADALPGTWRTSCNCPTTAVGLIDGQCILREAYYCKYMDSMIGQPHYTDGDWDSATKTCTCPDGYKLSDKSYKGCISEVAYECDYVGDVIGTWDSDTNTCNCGAGYEYHAGYGCIKDCLKITLDCDEYGCYDHVPAIYIKPGNATAYSDAKCTNVITSVSVPTAKDTELSCGLLFSYKDGIQCGSIYGGDDNSVITLNLQDCLKGNVVKDLYHETTLLYVCY